MRQIEEDERAVRRLLPQVRGLAFAAGERHPAWFIIGDAEALLQHRPTVLSFPSREVAMETIRGMLETYAPTGVGYAR